MKYFIVLLLLFFPLFTQALVVKDFSGSPETGFTFITDEFKSWSMWLEGGLGTVYVYYDNPVAKCHVIRDGYSADKCTINEFSVLLHYLK